MRTDSVVTPVLRQGAGLFGMAAPADARPAIGVIVPNAENPVHEEAAEQIALLAGARGLSVLREDAHGLEETERACYQRLLAAGVAGLIVMPVSARAHALYRDCPVPCVLLGSRTEVASLDYVVQDDYYAAYLVVSRLSQCGRRNIAFLSYPGAQGYSALDRQNGMLKAVKRSELSDLRVRITVLPSERLTDSYEAAKTLLTSDNAPNAIVGQNDYIALGALQAMEDLSLVPGRDVAVIGFDNLSLSSLPKIRLSTVTTVDMSVAERAFSLALRRIGEGTRAGRCGCVLAPRLVFRDSFPG